MSRTDRALPGWLALCAASALAAALAACGGAPVRSGDGADAKAPGKSAKRMIPARKGGGYYQDDGPGDEIPADLDQVPDAVPRLEPLHRFANRPYVVLGKEYVPNTSLQPYKARGIGSWYGKKFHGQKTSIGEPYDMFAMTAAHPTLAIPSYVRVTNPANGRSVVVRVTDRGPFHADRVIDLSYTAAYKLGYINNGSTLVEVESILPGDFPPAGATYAQVAPPPPVRPAAAPASAPAASTTAGDSRPDLGPAAQAELEQLEKRLNRAETPAKSSAMGNLFVQLGAFSSADNAESLRARLSRELDWLDGLGIFAAGGIHRVQAGPFANRGEADRVAEKIRLALGFKPTIVTR